jgi:mono/diheme cytochrome c family protein
MILMVYLLACGHNPYQEGARLYKIHCENCHMVDGKGLRGIIPPLINSDFLVKHKEQIPCMIRHGIKGEITVNDTLYNTEMPGIPELSAVQINNILNYVYHNWNTGTEKSNVREVEEALKNCP